MALERRAFLAALPLVPTVGSAAFRPPTGSPVGNRLDRPDIHAGDRPAGASFATRSAAQGLSGAASGAHPIAVLTAIETLRRGGSAVDAAVAMNACLGFLEPTSAGLGGDCYAMLWDPALGKVVGLAGSGASPRGLGLATVRERAPNGVIPRFGAVSVSVPGALDAWWTLHQRYGNLPWADILAPAITLCETGAPVPQIIGYYLARNVRFLQRPGIGVEESANALATYAPGGHAPLAGDVFRNPDLARTYRAVAEGGRDAFYDGPIADTIERYFRRIGGWMTRDDLRRHHSVWTDPLVTTYRGVEIYGMGENTQGLATLQMLNMLERFDLAGMGLQSPRSLQVQIEAKRLAYEDRARYYADPKFARVPTGWLNSKDYAAKRAALIDPDRINRAISPGSAPSHGDTTYFTVADAAGLMVSMIQSNFRGMGSGLVADGLGFMFQDRGELFSLHDGHPNLYQPGKRPFQTIIPGFSTRAGVPWLSFGVMGGDMQPMGQTQIVVNRVDYGLDAQAAGDSPRWHHEGSSQSMGEDQSGLGPIGLLRLEAGVPVATRLALADLGWPLGESDGGFGRYSCIERRIAGTDRVYAAASEMRADGIGLAF